LSQAKGSDEIDHLGDTQRGENNDADIIRIWGSLSVHSVSSISGEHKGWKDFTHSLKTIKGPKKNNKVTKSGN